jgi:hypothetical protein
MFHLVVCRRPIVDRRPEFTNGEAVPMARNVDLTGVHPPRWVLDCFRALFDAWFFREFEFDSCQAKLAEAYQRTRHLYSKRKILKTNALTQAGVGEKLAARLEG